MNDNGVQKTSRAPGRMYSKKKKKVVTDRFSDIHNHNKGVIEFFPGIYIENNYDFIEIKSNIKKSRNRNRNILCNRDIINRNINSRPNI